MDLREINQANEQRHPWELSRASALKKILENSCCSQAMTAALDIGCGDGFLIGELLRKFAFERIDAVDICLNAAQLASFSKKRSQINFHNSYDGLSDSGYSFISMFDVIEHIADDAVFLADIVERFAAPGTILFITVPAFNSLYSNHDRFLQHKRRYNLSQLQALVEKNDVDILGSGYLFSLLLPIRALSVIKEKIFGYGEYDGMGAGNWSHGYMTMPLQKILDMDNNLSLFLNKKGIKIPGLTTWILCRMSQ